MATPGVPPPRDAGSGLARYCTTAPIIRAGGSKRPAGDRHVPARPLRAGPRPPPGGVGMALAAGPGRYHRSCADAPVTPEHA
jgi:hypothetical protein